MQAGGGQFEVVTEHKPALDAADALLLTREAIVATGMASYQSILAHTSAHRASACFREARLADKLV